MSVGTSAALVAAGIGAAGSIGGALIGSHAASSAAAQQQAAAAKVAALAQQTTAQAQAGIGTAEGTLANLYAPYLGAGTQGVAQLQQAFAPGGSLAQQFAAPTAQQAAQTPGEQFMLQQGTQAVDRSAAARGGLNTGATLQALTQYGQGLASTGYQQAYNNSLNTFQTNHNNLLGGYLALSGIGQNAMNAYGGQVLQGAEAQGQFGMQGLQTEAGAITGGANAGAQGTLNAANSWNQGLAGVANAATGYSTQQSLNNIFGSGGNGYGNTIAPTLNTSLNNSGYFNPSSAIGLMQFGG